MTAMRSALAARVAACTLALALSACVSDDFPADMRGRTSLEAASAQPVTVPMQIHNNRLFVEVTVLRPDGTERPALAWINMGMPAPVLRGPIYDELGIKDGKGLIVRLGGQSLTVEPSAIVNGGKDGFWTGQFSPLPMELVLPPQLFADRLITFDYAARTLTLAPRGGARPKGVEVAMTVNDKTGFAEIEGTVDGHTAHYVIDCGGGFTWFRGAAVADWLKRHPDWLVAEGAVGSANQGMLDYAFETEGKIVRIPAMGFGALSVHDAEILASGPILGSPLDPLIGDLFWDNWGKRAAQTPVDGWIGANLLRLYRITYDYRGGVSYWEKLGDPDRHELDGIGISLVRKGDGGYRIGGVVRRDGRDTVSGAERGDVLAGIDGMEVTADSEREAVLSALHGHPGETRHLSLRRDGKTVEIDSKVTAF